jgi:hypothetical protein
VKFKRPEKSSSLDIRFSNGILEIPQLKIFDQTEILFRNLQAFEQCHGRNAQTFINDYIFKYFINENICSTNNFLWDVCEELDSHCRKRRHKWKATLKQVYFNNPCTSISVVAASFILILTVIQTVCSIIHK